MDSALAATSYEERDGQVCWRGVCLADGESFHAFVTGDVADRLYDKEGAAEFEAQLRGLATTGFARESLEQILAASSAENRDWAVAEAMAEAYLSQEHQLVWPWNTERDKRTPKASLPGADLIGFEVGDGEARLALGEVKSSADTDAPPNVMTGRSGMTHQIDTLATNLAVVGQILRWLLPRCKGTSHQASFNAAAGRFLSSGNKAVSLFGVLVRCTHPTELDLRTRGKALAQKLQGPTTCQLIGLYLPCAISELPARLLGGAA